MGSLNLDSLRDIEKLPAAPCARAIVTDIISAERSKCCVSENLKKENDRNNSYFISLKTPSSVVTHVNNFNQIHMVELTSEPKIIS